MAESNPKDRVAEAEDAARRAETRLREALDVLPEGIVFLDAEGRYVLWNRRYAEIYHRSADLFAPGARLEDTLRVGVARGDYPDAVGREEAWIAERMARLRSASGLRHEQRVADGRWLMIEERRTADGGVIGLRVDITDLKAQAATLEEALQKAKAANDAKIKFLADMSHELRTPLNGVLGLAQALAQTGLDARQRDLLRDILTSAAKLDQLVDGLLDYNGSGRAAAAPAAAPAGPVMGTPAGFHVLLADDNPTNRKVIELMLSAIGGRVSVAENGAEALEAWRSRAFDVVLMDLRMPVMDGLSAIRAIRDSEAQALRDRTPILVISANTSPADVAASGAAGADGHLGKPVKAEELVAALARALN